MIRQLSEVSVYCKTYVSHGGYTVLVDFNQEAIIYDWDINTGDSVVKVWDRRTSNFSKMENFVVLECMDRLLEKGYPPSNIELEKTYPCYGAFW